MFYLVRALLLICDTYLGYANIADYKISPFSIVDVFAFETVSAISNM